MTQKVLVEADGMERKTDQQSGRGEKDVEERLEGSSPYTYPPLQGCCIPKQVSKWDLAEQGSLDELRCSRVFPMEVLEGVIKHLTSIFSSFYQMGTVYSLIIIFRVIGLCFIHFDFVFVHITLFLI
jgi:hypothetical protein